MLLFSCCRVEKEVGSASGQWPASSVGVAPTAVEMLRACSKSESRILQYSSSSFARSHSAPPQSLSEAAARRVALQQIGAASAALAAEACDPAVCTSFVNAYMAAIRDGNVRWASNVADMFVEDAQLVTTERQTFQGKAACLKRLENGVEQLVKLAGKDAELPTFQIEGPSPTGPAAHMVRLALRRGMHKLAFKLEFTLRGGRIAHLRTLRC